GRQYHSGGGGQAGAGRGQEGGGAQKRGAGSNDPLSVPTAGDVASEGETGASAALPWCG
ncbi:unnamed protein product, partial [Closterium sp. Naga37s-1]